MARPTSSTTAPHRRRPPAPRRSGRRRSPRRRRPGASLGARTLWWRLRTRPLAYWTLTALLALVTAGFVHHETTGAAGGGGSAATRSVSLALRPLDRGDVVGSGDIARREVPADLAPTGVADDPVGHVVVEPIAEGEAVLARRLAPDGLSPTAALLPPDHRGVAVPRDVATPPIEVGDRVDVLAAFPVPAGLDVDATAGDDAPRSGAVATEALVVAVDDESVTVAVDHTEAAATVAALGQGVVALAVVGR